MKTSRKRKLIEVALPLEAINAASKREKSVRHGHPSTLHYWWARRPLAAARAVLFAQLVDDPSEHVDTLLSDDKLRLKAEDELKIRLELFQQSQKEVGCTHSTIEPTIEEVAADLDRQRLFRIIEDIADWNNASDGKAFEQAHLEIKRSCGDRVPCICDPFSGGGSIPLEAQRLGLQAYGSDLNPVAVVIGKAMIEVPYRFQNCRPANPDTNKKIDYQNAQGLAEDIKYYGEWMRKNAFEQIGNLYPEIDLPKEFGEGKSTVIAWLWARTVPSPDPAYGEIQVPLASTFLINSKKGREVWIEPILNRSEKTINYRIRRGGNAEEINKARNGTKIGRHVNFRCLLSNAAITMDHIRMAGRNGKMGNHLIAIVTKGNKKRIYLDPSNEQLQSDQSADPK